METRWIRAVVVGMLVVCSALLGTAAETSSAASGGSVEALKDALWADGFTVQEGQVVLIWKNPWERTTWPLP